MATKYTKPTNFYFRKIASAAQATSLLSLDGGTTGVIPGGTASNELLLSIYGSTSPRSGVYGSQVKLTGDAYLTFTFLGFEAGYDNDFNFNGIQLFSTEDYSNNTVTDISDTEGPFFFAGGTGTFLPFSFDVNNSLGVTNGSNPRDSVPPNTVKSWEKSATFRPLTMPVPVTTTTTMTWQFGLQRGPSPNLLPCCFSAVACSG